MAFYVEDGVERLDGASVSRSLKIYRISMERLGREGEMTEGKLRNGQKKPRRAQEEV